MDKFQARKNRFKSMTYSGYPFFGGVDGRQRCAEAKTIHGNETRKARTKRAEGMRRLRTLEDLGYALGIMSGPKTPGRKPNK